MTERTVEPIIDADLDEFISLGFGDVPFPDSARRVKARIDAERERIVTILTAMRDEAVAAADSIVKPVHPSLFQRHQRLLGRSAALDEAIAAIRGHDHA